MIISAKMQKSMDKKMQKLMVGRQSKVFGLGESLWPRNIDFAQIDGPRWKALFFSHVIEDGETKDVSGLVFASKTLIEIFDFLRTNN